MSGIAPPRRFFVSLFGIRALCFAAAHSFGGQLVSVAKDGTRVEGSSSLTSSQAASTQERANAPEGKARGRDYAGSETSTDHFAHAATTWRVTKRVSATVGYGGSFVRGNTIFLNLLTPSGSLDYNYQRPYASIAVDLYKGLTYKVAWNYYGFNEAGNTNPSGLATIPLQDFNRSNATFSFRYSF